MIKDVKRRARQSAVGRRKVVVVIGSGQVADPNSAAVGRLVAMLGFDLLTGGGRGVMEAVSRAFHETEPRKGIVIGVVPATVEGLELIEDRTAADVQYVLPSGYPNPWVELAVYTHLPDTGAQGASRFSRNHINVLSADAIVALPGREGTRSEIWLARQYGVPLIAFGEHHEAMPPGVTVARTLEDVRDLLLRVVGQD